MKLAELCTIYMIRYSMEYKRSWRHDKQRMIYLEPLKDKDLTEVTREDVELLHKSIGKRGKTTANKVVEQLRHMYNMAIDWEYLPVDFKNPVRKIKKYPTYPSREFVTQEQMPRLLQVVNEYPDRQAANVVKIALLTGMRFSEILNLKWEDVNLESGFLLLNGDKTKNGRAHYLPMPESLIKLFKSIRQVRNNPYVFPGRFEGSRRYHVDAEWRKIRILAGIPKVRFHDLRRTVGSWLIEQTGSLALVGTVLNQTNAHVTRIYSLYHVNQVKDELQRYSERLEAIGL